MPLSPIQLRVAEIVAGVVEGEGFALAGGAALILRGEVVRRTRDLDFFGPSPDAVDCVLPAVDSALTAAGLSVERVREAAGFARLAVSDAEERTELDLGADARLFSVEPGSVTPTLSSVELAVDKVLAIFGRAEARDFVDLMALTARYPLEHLFELAREKDLGFDIPMWAEMLARFWRLRRDEFDLDEASYERLVAVIAEWRMLATELSREPEADAHG